MKRNELIGWSASVERCLTELRGEHNTNLFIAWHSPGMLKLTACVICNLYWIKRRKKKPRIEFIKSTEWCAFNIVYQAINQTTLRLLYWMSLWAKTELTEKCIASLFSRLMMNAAIREAVFMEILSSGLRKLQGVRVRWRDRAWNRNVWLVFQLQLRLTAIPEALWNWIF